MKSVSKTQFYSSDAFKYDVVRLSAQLKKYLILLPLTILLIFAIGVIMHIIVCENQFDIKQK